MSKHTEFYVIMPAGSFKKIEAILGDHSGPGIPIPVRRAVNAYLQKYGVWTDKKQLEHGERPFKHWVVDGIERIIVES